MQYCSFEDSIYSRFGGLDFEHSTVLEIPEYSICDALPRDI